MKLETNVAVQANIQASSSADDQRNRQDEQKHDENPIGGAREHTADLTQAHIPPGDDADSADAPRSNESVMATAMDDQLDEETDDEQQLSEQATVSAKHMARLANLKVDRYRLVGNDNLLVKACVYKTAKLKAVTVEWPLVVPESMIPTILSLFHGDKAIIAHGGKHKTYGAMRKRFVWKGMVQSIRQWIGACHKCLIRKRQVPQHQRYNVHPKAVAPMNRICIDIVGPLVESSKGNNHILTIYDPFSHWPAAYAIPKTDSKTIVNCLKQHIALHSVPGEEKDSRWSESLILP